MTILRHHKRCRAQDCTYAVTQIDHLLAPAKLTSAKPVTYRYPCKCVGLIKALLILGSHPAASSSITLMLQQVVRVNKSFVEAVQEKGMSEQERAAQLHGLENIPVCV